MGLSRALSVGALALLSCGGRSGLLGLAESNSGGAPPALDGGMIAVGGTADGGMMAASGAVSGGASMTMGGALMALGGAGSSDRGGSTVGRWVTLNHQDPPAPAVSKNMFDYLGSSTAFTDVWSDDPSRALIATLTPGYKAPSSGGMRSFQEGALLPFHIGPEHLYTPPRLAGLSLSDLWLAENYFGLEHSDGSTWTVHAQPPAQLIWENSANDVWVCSSFTSTENVLGYQLSHWDGRVWTQIALPSLEGFAPRGLWGRSASDMYVSGTNSTLLHWNGAMIEVRACSTGVAWNAVWGESDALWTAGDLGAVARWQGDSCSSLRTRDLLNGGRAFSDIWGSGPDNLWIVGSGGAILHWNGSALQVEESGVADDLNAVWGTASGAVWVVGNNETLLRRAF
jgi:hypothetical protein